MKELHEADPDVIWLDADLMNCSGTLKWANANPTKAVNVGIADGSVRFVSDTIDAGSPNSYGVTAGKSPYGVWGALGTPTGGETSE